MRHVVPDLIFTSLDIYYRLDKPVQETSPADKPSPSVSLAQLLQHGVLGDVAHGGRFTDGDKAILAFSLSLCLLHLFRGLWMSEDWRADNIRFLYRLSKDKGQIFHIRYPYIEKSLSRGKSIDSDDFTLKRIDCWSCMITFAQLLVEIETGKPFLTLQQGEEVKDTLWKVSDKIEKGGKEDFARAIVGCIEFLKGLPDPNPRRPSKNSKVRQYGSTHIPESFFDQVRWKIWQDVVHPLEKHYRSFRDIIATPREGPLDIPDILNPAPSLKSKNQPSPTQTRNENMQAADGMFFFDDKGRSETDMYVSRWY